MKKTLIVFIHGIGSNKKTWEKLLNLLKTDEVQISQRMMSNIQTQSDLYFDHFEYHSSIHGDIVPKWINNHIFGKKSNEDISISDITDTLKDYLTTAKTEFDEIFLVAHSMGGIIALDCITKYKLYVDKLVFFATPLAGSPNSDEIKKYFNDKFFLRRKLFSFIVKELSTDSDTILSLVKRIGECQYDLKMTPAAFFNPSLDSRIAKESAEIAKQFCSHVYTTQKDHNTIKEPANKNDNTYQQFKDFLYDNSNKKEELSIERLKAYWHQQEKNYKEKYPFITLRSKHTTTIYVNRCVIDNLQYEMEMMEDGKIQFQHCFKPFDEIVNNELEKEAFYINQSTKRFSQKSYKIRSIPEKININVTPSCDDGWYCLEFRSSKISKGEKVTIEVSFSDIVDFSEHKKERFEQYFSYDITEDQMPHAIREKIYQIESYEDTEDTVKLLYEPILSVDGVEQINKNNCKQNIFYRSWNWKFYLIDSDHKKMHISLQPRKNIYDCIQAH